MPMSIFCNRIFEVPIQASAPKAYILHDARKNTAIPNQEYELQMNIEFQDITEFFSALRDLYILFKQKGH